MNYPTHYFEWLDFWLEFYYRPAVKTDTYKINSFNVKILKKHTENRLLVDVNEIYCQSILNEMRDNGYAKGSIQKVATILRQSLTRAKSCNCIEKIPTDLLIIPQAPTKRIKALEQEQQRKLEEVCQQVPKGELFLFLLDTGLRRKEMINLEWSHFNKKRREIYVVDSKTENGIRTIPLITRAYNIIIQQEKSKNDNYIFHGAKGSKLSYDIMRKLYNRIRKLTGFHDFTNHVCRHSFATRLIEKNANPKSVAALLGHAKVEYALNIYTDLERKHLTKEIHLLEK